MIDIVLSVVACRLVACRPLILLDSRISTVELSTLCRYGMLCLLSNLPNIRCLLGTGSTSTGGVA